MATRYEKGLLLKEESLRGIVEYGMTLPKGSRLYTEQANDGMGDFLSCHFMHDDEAEYGWVEDESPVWEFAIVEAEV